MQSQTERPTQVKAEVDVVDERCQILEEVNFKWLMAGMKCWVDMPRFRSDPLYAARFLKLALESDSLALRRCAAALEAQNGITCKQSVISQERNPLH